MDFQNVEHNGVKYIHYSATFPGMGALSIDDKRIILNGQFRATLTEGSYKFGRELQFCVLATKESKQTTITARNPSAWNRLEIFIPLVELPGMIKALQEFQNIIYKDIIDKIE
jgi:hypothetical protein